MKPVLWVWQLTSDLIMRQASGEWETRDNKLIPYRKHVKDLRKRFKSVEFSYIPQFHNELADALATLASMLPYPGNVHIDPLEIQIRERHGYCNAVVIELDIQPWCVDSQETGKIMNEVHSGVYGPRMNRYVLAKKILRAVITGRPWKRIASVLSGSANIVTYMVT
ncbi:PREDICTED: uncharacterized protein LOC109231489 [Nicotiana attenuata]|uniref:uncharacterized protein LOC109231489 n=1 Tax=Nicotiana attenuata TaxID=49451 RepID=UPI0009055AEB|nr:PREDICTED: uncharacterized protein LOC109231489 [Nicotiana attenuata]